MKIPYGFTNTVNSLVTAIQKAAEYDRESETVITTAYKITKNNVTYRAEIVPGVVKGFAIPFAGNEHVVLTEIKIKITYGDDVVYHVVQEFHTKDTVHAAGEIFGLVQLGIVPVTPGTFQII